MSTTVKITSKGQVTLPKTIRDFLDSQFVEFEIEHDKVLIKPVKSVGGSLAKYAKTYTPIEEAREQTWSKVADERSNYSA